VGCHYAREWPALEILRRRTALGAVWLRPCKRYPVPDLPVRRSGCRWSLSEFRNHDRGISVLIGAIKIPI
jgi:hypothetical protein